MRRGVLRSGEREAVIPVRALHYPRSLRDDWQNRWSKFRESGHQDWRVWGKYARIARECGFDRWTGSGGYFAEAQAALELEAAGYRVWHGPLLFPYGKNIVSGLDDIVAVEAALRRCGLPRPSEFAGLISPRPRNPDLTAVRRGRWRFLEAKQHEAVTPGQLTALAALKELFGGRCEVEVVRVVPEGVVVETERTCRYSVA